MMKRTASLVATLAAMVGCASYPAPVQKLADAEATSRGAQEVGVSASPQAQLHLAVAQEEITRAKQLMNDGDNEKADFMLLRAKADAELALGFARETQAQAAASMALEQVAAMQNQVTTSTTTTSTTTTTSAPPVTTTTTSAPPSTTTGGQP
jgi:PBP1b-binding outer membrane lipoprotein LpoB